MFLLANFSNAGAFERALSRIDFIQDQSQGVDVGANRGDAARKLFGRHIGRRTENLKRLAAALSELHPTLRGAPKGLPFTIDQAALLAGSNFTLDTDAGPLDLLGWVEPLGDFEKVVSESMALPFGARTVRALSVDALIRIKRHIGRPKDKLDLLQLEAIRRLREGEQQTP